MASPVQQDEITSFEQVLAQDVFETSFRRQRPLAWLITLVGPFVVTGMVLAFVYLLEGKKIFWQLLGAAGSSFVFLGRFVILAGSDAEVPVSGSERFLLTSSQLFVMVTYMDVLTAILLAFHTSFLFKLPYLGSKLRELVVDGQFILKSHPWMKRATFIGLAAFVMFPVACTGSVGGAIFGRLLGMSRISIVVATAIGSVLGNGMMYFFASLIDHYLGRDSPLAQYAGYACIVALVLLLNHRYRVMKRQHLEREAKRSSMNAGSTDRLPA